MEHMFMEKGERKIGRKPVLENTTYKLLPAKTEQSFDGVLTDISKSGACLLTTSPLKEGQIILIGDNRYCFEKSAIVIWSQKIGDMLYKSGLEYKDNIVSLNITNTKSAETADLKQDPQTKDHESTVVPSKEHVPFHKKKGTDSRNKILSLIIIFFWVLLTTGGILFYTNSSNNTEIQPLPKKNILKPTKSTVKNVVVPAEQSPQKIPKATKSVPHASRKMKSSPKQAYSVQVGAFKSEENAHIVSKIYREKGYEVFVDESVMKDKEILYKVLIGKFENKKDAFQFANDINSKENIDAIIDVIIKN